MQAKSVLKFILAVLASLGLLCIIFPNDGMSFFGTTLKFPSIAEVISVDKDTIATPQESPKDIIEKRKSDLEIAIKSITSRLATGGMFVASIRDYDALLESKPPYSAPYIHKTEKGQRVSFQTWSWDCECYRLIQYIIEDEETLKTNKFECEYRAVRREELTNILLSNGCNSVVWKLPEETGFYQPIVIAKK